MKNMYNLATIVKVIISMFVYVCSGYYLEWLLSGYWWTLVCR